MIQKIKGLVAAPFTPMLADGEIYYDLIPNYYKLLRRNRIVGVFINGSSGEGASLTFKEKAKITRRWVEQKGKGDDMKIINLVGGTSYGETIESAIMSSEAGVDAIALVSPYYFVPDDPGQLAEFCAKVAASVPDMPVYFYHIPVLTGCNIPMLSFLERASDMIPNLVGIKYTHEDFMDFLSCLSFNSNKYDMLWGRDENILPALSLGARGAVGSTYNYAAPLYQDLIRAFDSGDLNKAIELQQLSVNMIMLLGKYGGISTGKAFMRFIGLDCGAFRSPVKNEWINRYPEFVKDVKSLKMDKLFSKP
ncbi:MAG: dihydrodipicolinate synthase family protein [Bacteroidota bacterium]|nr:dihydrodipicolinate synthase family protein [Bacteroidota bacterium]